MSNFLLRLIGYLPSSVTDWIRRKVNGHRPLNRLAQKYATLFRNREVEITSGLGKGLLINVGGSAATYVMGTFKPELQSFLGSAVKPGDVFLDVGANVGFFSLLAAKVVGPKGKVISFEPLPENLLRLGDNVRRNQFSNIQILPLALGAANEERLFQVSERPTWGKFKNVGHEAPDKYLCDIKVAVRRLDDLLRDGVVERPDFVKMDVEGAEIEVVEGAKETLLRYGPTLMIELHGTGNLLTAIFAKIGYCAIPLNERFDSVAQAHWNAMILAFPAQRAKNIASAGGFSSTLMRLFPTLASQTRS